MSKESDDLCDRKILVGLSGGIACYKVAAVVSQLTQRGAKVRVMMTEAATHFIGPLTLRSLSGQTVVTSIWQSDRHAESPHIGLARWCEALLIAPASADMLGRLAHGLTPDIVSLVACALPAPPAESFTPDAASNPPLLIAPAMNADMWANPLVQRNVALLRDVRGARFIGPDTGWQACRTRGDGRMAEPEAICDALAAVMPHADATEHQ